ncbi:MAG: hypothetical protein A4E41_00712 [Methanoregulaceae archaeon PtaU1.Bin066]|nr:MAG: hypothetical protein A4E41_00712 [Methanoregulaceae archaeon PtaU1.Bin066]
MYPPRKKGYSPAPPMMEYGRVPEAAEGGVAQALCPGEGTPPGRGCPGEAALYRGGGGRPARKGRVLYHRYRAGGEEELREYDRCGPGAGGGRRAAPGQWRVRGGRVLPPACDDGGCACGLGEPGVRGDRPGWRGRCQDPPRWHDTGAGLCRPERRPCP